MESCLARSRRLSDAAIAANRSIPAGIIGRYKDGSGSEPEVDSIRCVIDGRQANGYTRTATTYGIFMVKRA
jgi:hypothetical protein